MSFVKNAKKYLKYPYISEIIQNYQKTSTNIRKYPKISGNAENVDCNADLILRRCVGKVAAPLANE